MFDFGKISPAEAIAFFLAKILLSDEEFAQLEDEAKATAFTIAELAKQTELEFMHSSLLTALEEGMGFSEWKSSIKEIWQKKGWENFRVKTIYQTNMHQAKAVGSWKQMQETKEALPYLRYSAILDSQTRPSHSKMHGIVLPIDDDFWKKFYPPNGFNCRCQAYAITKRKAEKLGITPDVAKVGFADNGWDSNPALSHGKNLSKMREDKKKVNEDLKKRIKEKLDSEGSESS